MLTLALLCSFGIWCAENPNSFALRGEPGWVWVQGRSGDLALVNDEDETDAVKARSAGASANAPWNSPFNLAPPPPSPPGPSFLAKKRIFTELLPPARESAAQRGSPLASWLLHPSTGISAKFAKSAEAKPADPNEAVASAPMVEGPQAPATSVPYPAPEAIELAPADGALRLAESDQQRSAPAAIAFSTAHKPALGNDRDVSTENADDLGSNHSLDSKHAARAAEATLDLGVLDGPEPELSRPAPAPAPELTPELASTISAAPLPKAPTVARGTVWPEVKSLRAQLSVCQQVDAWHPWQSRLDQTLAQIECLPSLDAVQLPSLLQELSTSAGELTQIAEAWAQQSPNLEHRRQAEALERLGCEIDRRVRVWRAVAELTAESAEGRSQGATATLNTALRRWNLDTIPPAWREFLYLDELFAAESDPQLAARRTLARMYSQALDPNQRSAVEQWIPAEFEAELRATAMAPAPQELLLRDVESFHHQTNGRTAGRLIDHFQNAYWSDRAADLQLAAVLNQHYRNANVRVTLSKALLNQVLAHPEWLENLGTEGLADPLPAGRGRASSAVQVDLIPDPTSWNLSFAARGSLLSRAPAQRDGFVFKNFGPTEIRGARRVAVTLDGGRRAAPPVEHLADVSLHSVRRNSSLPLRESAEADLNRETSPTTASPTTPRTRVRLRIQQRVEAEVEQALQETRDQLKREFVQPLAALDLDPQPIEMSTTAEELILRYRLAGLDQLAAYAPRPEVPAGRLATLQIHESCLNNLLSRLDLADQSFDAAGLRAQLQARLPRMPWGEETSGNAEARFQVHFGPYDPIRIDLVDGGLNLSLRFKRLQLDPRAEGWRNVTITTRYQPELDGFQLRWVQVGGVTAASKSISRGEEIAIAGAFSGLLKSEYRIALLPTAWQAHAAAVNATVEQLDVQDGWLSVVWSSTAAPEDASGTERLSDSFRVRRRTLDR